MAVVAGERCVFTAQREVLFVVEVIDIVPRDNIVAGTTVAGEVVVRTVGEMAGDTCRIEGGVIVGFVAGQTGEFGMAVVEREEGVIAAQF